MRTLNEVNQNMMRKSKEQKMSGTDTDMGGKKGGFSSIQEVVYAGHDTPSKSQKRKRTSNRKDGGLESRRAGELEEVVGDVVESLGRRGLPASCELCPYTCTPDVNNLTIMFHSTSNHILQHFPSPLFFCRVCDIHVRNSNDHWNLEKYTHWGFTQEEDCLDLRWTKQRELMILYGDCFLPRGFAAKEREAKESEKRNRRIGYKIAAPSDKLPPPKNNNNEMDRNKTKKKSNGKENRTSSKNSLLQSRPATKLHKLIVKLVKRLSEGKISSLKCQYKKCDFVKTNSSKSTNNFISITCHLSRHFPDKLYYCTLCKDYFRRLDVHAYKFHKISSTDKRFIDLHWTKEKELIQLLNICFPSPAQHKIQMVKVKEEICEEEEEAEFQLATVTRRKKSLSPKGRQDKDIRRTVEEVLDDILEQVEEMTETLIVNVV